MRERRLKGEGEIRLKTESIDSHAVIHVEDTGSGIPEDLRQKIFEPFFTHGKSLKGFGLGMSITQRIIADHSGRIELHSELGKGTTFSIWLPLAADNPRAKCGGRLGSRMVLLVNSSEAFLENMRVNLRGGYVGVTQHHLD